jgi:hypothetical protein
VRQALANKLKAAAEAAATVAASKAAAAAAVAAARVPPVWALGLFRRGPSVIMPPAFSFIWRIPIGKPNAGGE